MSFTVEKDWITAAGLRAAVIMGSQGSRCGYVAVPAEHPLHGVGYHDQTQFLRPASDEPIGKRSILGVLASSIDGAFQSPDCAFDVHGGLTYSGPSGYPAEGEGLWWFGYDCAHLGDSPSDEHIESQRAAYPDKPFMWGDRDGVHRTLDYCIAECEWLATQIVEKTAEPLMITADDSASQQAAGMSPAPASRTVGDITYAARHPGTHRVTVTLEIESAGSLEDLNEAITSFFAGQEGHYQGDSDDGEKLVDVEFTIISAETDTCRVDYGVTP